MKKSVNLVVKESITEALLILMKKKNFYDINITELTKLAGVSRISFYRNFESKEDVLIRYMYERAMSLFSAFNTESLRDKQIGMFKSIEGIEDIIRLLYSQNLSHLFLQYLNFACGAKPEQSNIEAYQSAITMGICFGILNEWLQRGRKESPEEMVEILQQTLRRFLVD